MFEAPKSPYLAPFDGSFVLDDASSSPPKDAASKKDAKRKLEHEVEKLAGLQHVLYADDRYSVLLIFQALDAAGKDGTIRAVLTGLNPIGCQVFSFKQPSMEELDHDFLWRTSCRLPEKGRIGVFNRSYYEEVLVVRVHPQYLAAQNLPHQHQDLDALWRERYASIHDHELHLARNGTIILKFWLHVSRKEQRRRFLARLEEPEKNWKFSAGDVAERAHWDAYMRAYREAVAATSRPWAPWYVIPADNKPFMRLTVAELVVQALEGLDLRYPKVADSDRERFGALHEQLTNER